MDKKFRADMRLVKGLLENDHQIVKEIYQNMYPVLRNWLRKKRYEEGLIEDLIQETLEITLLKIRKENFQLTGRLYAYIMGICKNVYLRKQEKNYRAEQFPLNEQSIKLKEEFDDVFEQRDQLEFIWQCVAKLGQECKELIESFYRFGKKLDELSTKFSHSNPASIRVKKARCMKRLRQILLKDPRYQEFRS